MRDSNGRFVAGSKINLGRVMSKETKKKISETKKKHPTKYWKGKKRGVLSKEWREKISLANKGKKHSNEWKENMSKGMKTSKKAIAHRIKLRERMVGSNNPGWKGGISKTIEWKKTQRRNVKHKRANYKIGVLTLDTVKQVYSNNIKKYAVLTCIYCLKSVKDNDSLEHKTPLSRGGTNDINNLAIACMKCNVVKNARTEEEYRKILERDKNV